MDDHSVDVAVIGAGPMGSATAKYAAEGASVALIGPDDALDFSRHEGAWSGWADQGRAFATIDIPLLCGIISSRSGRRFADLEHETGVTFRTPNPQLTVAPEGLTDVQDDKAMSAVEQDYYNPKLLMSRAEDLGHEAHYLDSEGLSAAYPALKLPPAHEGVVQPNSFIINPRRLVEAQRRAAVARGAVHIAAEVRSWEKADGAFVLKLHNGGVVRAAQIVLAAGPYNNLSGLVPRALDLTVYGFTIALAEVDPGTPGFPTMLAVLASEKNPYGGIIAPPIQYPDGKWYIKSAGTSLVELKTLRETNEWVRSGGDPVEAERLRGVLAEIMPEVVVRSSSVRPCLASINASAGYPYIGAVDEGVTLVTEGENGVSMSDECGRLAARLVLDGEWRDSLPAGPFTPRFR